ncbi:MAG: hypothetical protein HRF42_14830 [Candidatus Brocadia sp.]
MKERPSAFGIDFPFGLPQSLIKEKDWEAFVLSFPQKYPNAEEFRKSLYISSGGYELKRVTDRECQTPFSPYNLRLYRQTYFGICEVLSPLIRNHLVCVLPMQRALPGKTWLLEVCPASTLKQAGLYSPYKGNSRSHYSARTRILNWLEEACGIPLPGTARLTFLDDNYGDALDSAVAAVATFRAIRNRAYIATIDNDTYLREGYVFV